jgi:hypothetical protein
MARKLEGQCEKYSRNIRKVCIVFDLKGLPAFPSPTAFKMLQRQTYADEEYYSEGLQTLIVINAPIYFTAIWAIVKLWLDPVTQNKIRICGGNYLDALKAVFPVEHIPVEYGGTKEGFAWTYPENYV